MGDLSKIEFYGAAATKWWAGPGGGGDTDPLSPDRRSHRAGPQLEASEHGDARMTERYRKVPEARLSRLAALGQMAAVVAAGALGEGMGSLRGASGPG